MNFSITQGLTPCIMSYGILIVAVMLKDCLAFDLLNGPVSSHGGRPSLSRRANKGSNPFWPASPKQIKQLEC